MTTIAPTKPMISPAIFSRSGRSVASMMANPSVNSGIVPMSVAARLLLMCSCADVISVNGITLLNSAVNASDGHTLRDGMTRARRSATGTSRHDAMISRPATTVSGGTERTTSLVNKNAAPQRRLSSSNAAVSRGLTLAAPCVSDYDHCARHTARAIRSDRRAT